MYVSMLTNLVKYETTSTNRLQFKGNSFNLICLVHKLELLKDMYLDTLVDTCFFGILVDPQILNGQWIIW